MFATPITIVGNVVDEPRIRTAASGDPVVSFRVASTERIRDRESANWVDGRKLFVTVTAWNQLARNIADSVRKGHPVMLTGTICSREYEKDGTFRVNYEVKATAVGHDLSRGSALFSKVTRASVSTSVETGPDGMPADMTSYLDAESPIDGDPDAAAYEVDGAPYASADDTSEPVLVGAGARG